MPKDTVSESHVNFELSEHLPYLFKHVHSQLEVVSAGQLARFGVNVAVWRILAVLWEHDDLSHRDLSDLTSIEVSTLSRVSRTVQRRGLIRRTRTKEDQRTVRVTLTEKGRQLVQAIIPWARGCQALIVGNLSPKDVEALTRILHQIVANLDAVLETEREIAEQKSTKSATKQSTGSPPARKPSAKMQPRKRAAELLE